MRWREPGSGANLGDRLSGLEAILQLGARCSVMGIWQGAVFCLILFPSKMLAQCSVQYFDDQFLMCRRSLASSLVGCPPSQTVLGHRSKTASSYRWGQGQGQVYPLFISVSCCQSCPTLHVQDDGEWNDQLCSKTAQYMCETPAIQGGAELVVPTTPKPVVAGQINTSFSTSSPPPPPHLHLLLLHIFTSSSSTACSSTCESGWVDAGDCLCYKYS